MPTDEHHFHNHQHQDETLSCRLSIRHRSESSDFVRSDDGDEDGLPRRRFSLDSFSYSSSGSSMSLSDLATSASSSSSSNATAILKRGYGDRYRKAWGMLRRGRASLPAALSATLNFTNSILGAGLMGIPYAFRQAGMIPGIVLLVAVGLVSDWSVGLMVKSGKRVGARSYQELMGRTFGPAGSYLCALFQVTFAIGCLCIYQMIIAENLNRLFAALTPDSLLADRSFITLAGALFGLLPLSLAKDLGVLGRAALLSVGGNILITLCVLWESHAKTTGLTSMAAEESFRWAAPGFIQAIGVIAFSFVCHHNSFLIQGSLGTRSLALFSAVASTSIAFSLVISLLLAVPSYWAFGTRTDPNILNNLSRDSPLINGCRLVFAVSLYLTYPLDCFVARDVLVRTCFPRASCKKPRMTHYVATLAIVAFTTAITLTFEDLGAVLELTGGVTASALAFIFPAACYLKLACKRDKCMRAGAYGLLYFGCLVMILATAGPLFKSSPRSSSNTYKP